MYGLGDYDPARDGTPSHPGTASSMEEFMAQRDALMKFYAGAGLVSEYAPGEYTNAVAFGPGLPTPDQYRQLATEWKAQGAPAATIAQGLKDLAGRVNEIAEAEDDPAARAAAVERVTAAAKPSSSPGTLAIALAFLPLLLSGRRLF